MSYTIRPVRESDAAAIVEMFNPIITAGTMTIVADLVTLETQLSFIRGFPERGVFHMAVCDETSRILGMQDVAAFSNLPACQHVGEIATFVALDSHRQGVGRRLSEATFREASRLGFRKLIAMVRADNPSAVGFYSAMGFDRIGITHQHAQVRGEYIDEVLMERFLD